jgi:hypothetical protein
MVHPFWDFNQTASSFAKHPTTKGGASISAVSASTRDRVERPDISR